MTRNKKLRLLVTKECFNDCPQCCNKNFDLDLIPIVDRFDYEEINITSGDPMKNPHALLAIVTAFKTIGVECYDHLPLVYVYTSRLFWADLPDLLARGGVDGFTVTPHSDADIRIFKKLNYFLQKTEYKGLTNFCSLRLNLFPDVKAKLEGENLELWLVKEVDWRDNCPVPEGEDLRRINW